MTRTRNFADIIRAKIAADPDLAEAIKKESFNADLAIKLYEVRTEAGLSQAQLADRIGTSQSVISRLEDADYDGHSLSLLKKIAEALGKNLRVEFYTCPETQKVHYSETFSPHWRTVPADWQAVRWNTTFPELVASVG
jgi:transcriptional regulator with XRE-family HTH domain